MNSITICRWYKFKTQHFRPSYNNYLVLSNHVTHLDPFLLAEAFPRHMYFVASEHLLRTKISTLMMLLTAPILRIKSRTEANTAMDIMRRLRQGNNVCIFIEGERSYDGCTEYIATSAGHLARLCGTALVTYRLEGGYFTEPRWAHGLRRGGMSGHIVNCYTPEQLHDMNEEDVQTAIRNDLWVDAYAEQEKNPRIYPSHHGAEYLENTLFLCPCCGQYGTLHSSGNRFYCDCGLDLRYTKYCWLENSDGTPAPFRTVRDWYAWQKEQIQQYAAIYHGDKEKVLLFDSKQQLYRSHEGDIHPKLIGEGVFRMYADRIEFDGVQPKLILPLNKIEKISCHEAKMLSFSANRFVYELKSTHPRAAIKYQLLFNALCDHLFQERNT